jgi:hypothetical protein
MYKLTKYFLNEGAHSEVKVGQDATGTTLKVIREVAPEELRVGDEVYVGSNWTNFIKTSPLKRIAKVNEKTTTLWTQTSTYHLDVDDEQEITVKG